MYAVNDGKTERLEDWLGRRIQDNSINKTVPGLHGSRGVGLASPPQNGDAALRVQQGLLPPDKGSDITRQTGDASLYSMQLRFAYA